MRILLILKLSLTIAIILNGIAANAQQAGTPLIPGKAPPKTETGLFVGFGQNWQTGEFNVLCDCPVFMDGVGFGISFGGLYEQEIFKDFRWGAALGFDSRNLSSSYLNNEASAIQGINTEYTDTIPILFRHNADATLNQIKFKPYLKWYPAHFLFIRIGAGLSYLVSTNIKHSKELVQKTVLLGNGEIDVITLVDNDGNRIESNSVTIEDREFQDINAMQLSLEPAIGLNFRAGRNIFISPTIEYSIPFSNISEFGNEFRVYSWRFTVEVRLDITKEAR